MAQYAKLEMKLPGNIQTPENLFTLPYTSAPTNKN